jgi:hypothetical protein
MAKSVHKILLQIEYHNAEFFALLSKKSSIQLNMPKAECKSLFRTSNR